MTVVELANYKNGKFARFQIDSKNKQKKTNEKSRRRIEPKCNRDECQM